MLRITYGRNDCFSLALAPALISRFLIPVCHSHPVFLEDSIVRFLLFKGRVKNVRVALKDHECSTAGNLFAGNRLPLSGGR